MVTLGDSWLGPAIRANHVVPIRDAETFRWWVSLPALTMAKAFILGLHDTEGARDIC